MFFCSVILLF
uniref:NADH-plastoquinone oxidoreductase subunit 6 n=2 Tax=Collabieae TaxID=1769749 RepID=A0A6C0STH8_9ASPA|nr:NADH-plastoquinone oxidoreductase subunit 6 [Tainia dunnii]QIA92465.1 NADH-plastoquinone oxidoreductase subunit 6 [Tainia dunnii]UDY72306.1 NADH-plastoquinone oxidoreductase subunit 6 [Hancockia uniflora]